MSRSPDLPTTPPIVLPQHTRHERRFADNRFVYPVISRRSQGLSLGVNLNPDKICNFDCIYCQVDRTRQAETRFVATAELLAELDEMLAAATSGSIFESPELADTPAAWRRLNDIAFSGDGEPTTYRNFDEIIAACAEIKRRHEAAALASGAATSILSSPVKMVLITNASQLHRPHVQRGLAILDQNHGEIWAKLEWGTEAYYRLIERTPVPMRQVLDNITAAAKVRPIVIQSLFMRVDGAPPPADELAAYTERLNEIVAAGGQIKLVQIYTVARRPAESYVTPLPPDQIDSIAQLVSDRCGLPVERYYGAVA